MQVQKREVNYYEETVPKDLEAFKEWEFTSGGTTGKDFMAFSRLFKKYIKNNLPNGAELVEFSGGHYICSGFVKRGEKFVYFSVSDVRHFKNSWMTNILIRTAKHEKDYTGGSNNFTTLENFKSGVERLLEMGLI